MGLARLATDRKRNAAPRDVRNNHHLPPSGGRFCGLGYSARLVGARLGERHVYRFWLGGDPSVVAPAGRFFIKRITELIRSGGQANRPRI